MLYNPYMGDIWGLYRGYIVPFKGVVRVPL